MVRTPETIADGLVHVVVCGGTPREWVDLGVAGWSQRFSDIANGVGHVGANWVTVLPHHGGNDDPEAVRELAAQFDHIDKIETVELHGCTRFVWRRDDGINVVVDPSADGHARFARVVGSLAAAGAAIDETSLSGAVLSPVRDEPDLVLILGPPDRMPTSLVWELAYSELVFLDIKWSDLQSTHLEMAIDDFNRRHRRFGGLDS